MSDVDPWGDSDPEDIFGRKEVKKPSTPYEIEEAVLDDPYRMFKVDLSSLINSSIEPMTVPQICQSYRELFCEDLSNKARTMGLTLTQLFEAVSDTITPLKGPSGLILYTAIRSDKTKDIRSQIVQQQRGVKKRNDKKWSAYVSRSRTVNNNNTKKAGTIPMSSLSGGPRSDERCGIIVKIIREHGTCHQTSGRIRMRITKLQEVYAEILNKLPLWGSTKTEKEYADGMGSPEYAKYWQISSEKNLEPCSHDDEFVYFIDVDPDGQGDTFSLFHYLKICLS